MKHQFPARAAGLAVALGLALGAAACQRTTAPPAAQPPQPPPAAAQSNAEALQRQHETLLAETKNLPAPDFMPIAQAAASHDAAPVAAAAAEAPLPPVAPEQMVHLVLTSGVIGEIDPCG